MTSKGEDSFHSHHYVYIHRLLLTVGLLPDLNRSKRLVYITFFSILFLIGIIAQIYLIVRAILEKKKELIPELLQTFLPTFQFAVAYWYLMHNTALLKEIFEHVKNDWSNLKSEDELNIMEAYAAQSRIASISVAWAFMLYILLLILPCIIQFFLYITGIIDRTKVKLPIHNDDFVDTTFLYYFGLSLELSIIGGTYMAGITHYILYINFLQHACALFLIVTHTIDEPFRKNKYKFNWTSTGTKREAEFRWIVTVAKQYNNAINFVELIRSLYGRFYLVELFIAFSLIAADFIYFFQLINFMITTIEAVKICLYIYGTMFMIYAYFYLGERLIQHSTSVYDKCLLIPFYTLSGQINKLLLLLITKSLKACNLSVSGIAVASHQLFAKIVKVSFSFATVCYKIR